MSTPTERVLENLYGTEVSLSVAGLDDLGNTLWWQSDIIDNTTLKAFWATLRFGISAGGNGTADGLVHLYLASSMDGVNFSGNANGASGVFTPVLSDTSNFYLVRPIPVNATVTRVYDTVQAALQLERYFRIVVHNEIGASLASGNIMSYALNKAQSAPLTP